MHQPIYLIGGDKGGVGKSLFSMVLIDYFMKIKEPIVLVETDTSNPDVWRSYEEAGDPVISELINLDQADGWITAVNLLEQQPHRTVVINTAARNHVGLTAYGATLEDALPELKRSFICWWVINRQRDSLNLLNTFIESMPHAKIHVVRNLYWGAPEKFELYNHSKIREAVEMRGGQTVDFPEVADRVADDLFSNRLSIHDAAATLPLGNRAELNRWRKACARMLEEVVETVAHESREATA